MFDYSAHKYTIIASICYGILFYLEKVIKCSCHHSNLLRKPHHKIFWNGKFTWKRLHCKMTEFHIKELCVWHHNHPKYILCSAQFRWIIQLIWFDLFPFEKHQKSLCMMYMYSIRVFVMQTTWNESRVSEIPHGIKNELSIYEQIWFLLRISASVSWKQNNYETKIGTEMRKCSQ